jgi:hypothetical protein
VRAGFANIHKVPFCECTTTLLRCIIFSRPTTAVGQFLPPSLATAMEELASTPDAEAHHRYASFWLIEWLLQ